VKGEKPKNLVASVRARLSNYSQKHHEDFQLVLTRYVIERFLYRLSVSEYRAGFILKGAMLFQLWTEIPHRATRDVDLLGIGESSVERITSVMKAVCAVPVPDDGLTFDPESVAAGRIKEDQEYEGVRVACEVRLGQARISLQIDIGFGDAVTPSATEILFPTLLDFPAPILAAYPRATVVSEKFQAMVALGLGNSRLKDFFDLWTLARAFEFDGAEIARAIEATFRRRKTPVPRDPPLALTPGFGADASKRKQWEAFLRKGKLESGGMPLEEVCAVLSGFLMPPAQALAVGKKFAVKWRPGGPWE
jgi:hypothetical protein